MKALNDKELKQAGIALLATNPQHDELFMAKDGQGFPSRHDAEVFNSSIGFKGKEGEPLVVTRKGNEDAIEKLAAAEAKAHEKAVASSLAEQAKLREEKAALKQALKDLNKG